ncbi:hypothetical protein E0K89_021330, partial [Aquicoccus sp. SCR17]|nr:hypothetical protein [Carideicomes alvinocaridis]
MLLYRAIWTLLAPLLAAGLALRVVTGRERGRDLAERLLPLRGPAVR